MAQRYALRELGQLHQSSGDADLRAQIALLEVVFGQEALHPGVKDALRRELGVSWQRLKDHLRERRETRAARKAGTPGDEVNP